MILDNDNVVVENVLDAIPITTDYLESLGFETVDRFIFEHRTFGCRLELFYYKPTPLYGLFPGEIPAVRAVLFDPIFPQYDDVSHTFGYNSKTVYFISQQQVKNYVDYLTKMQELKKLQYEIHDFIENKIIPKQKIYKETNDSSYFNV